MLPPKAQGALPNANGTKSSIGPFTPVSVAGIGIVMLLVKCSGGFDFGAEYMSGQTSWLTSYLTGQCNMAWSVAVRIDPTNSMFGKSGLALLFIGICLQIVRVLGSQTKAWQSK
jgi:hypothetical protein